jgi:DNA-binding SARP family transcriptional activator
MALAPLELVCFGPPLARLAGAEPPREVQWRKHFALLTYLALSPSRSRTRDHLVGLFWPEQPDRKARKSLDMALHRLRRVLGEERLSSAKDAVVLSGDQLDVDVLRFSAEARAHPDEALRLVRGEFLEGFHLDAAQEFEDWMTSERRRYQELATAALVATGERRLAENRLEEATDLAHRALGLAPRLEPAAALLMRARMLAGDSAGALTAFQDFAAAIREIGEEPNRALSTLADRVRSEASARPKISPTETEPPLVGRQQLHKAVFEAVSGTRSPRALLITAPPGMGRSRLLAECVRRSEVDGAVVVQTRAVESDQDAPWSALRLLIRAGLATAPGLPAAPRSSLAALAELVPELAERFTPRPVRDVSDMAAALADVLGAISEERPILIGLDDAHWADGPSLAALGTALGKLTKSSVLLVVTVAQGVGEPPRELDRLQGDIGHDIPGLTVRLGALDQGDLAALVAALAPWCRDAADRDRLTRRLAFETGGSPFFAVTLLGSLAKASTLQKDFVSWPPPRGTHGAPPPFSVPSVVKRAIQVRAGELATEELAVLRAASVCGQALDCGLIATVAGVPVDTVERALPAFERRQFVQFDGTRYAFAAPMIADVVRTECLTRGERRTLEGRAAAALETHTDLESRALRAELLAHIAPDAASGELALSVAREALDAGARRTAQRALAAARQVAKAVPFDAGAIDALSARLTY